MVDDRLAEQLKLEASDKNLMAWLASGEKTEHEQSACISTLAHLHRSGKLNVLEHLQTPKGESDWRFDHNMWTRVYRELLPLLDAEPASFSRTIARLATGMWIPDVQEGFLDWCVCEPSRIDGILELEGSPDLPEFCLTAALIAGVRLLPNKYLETTFEFAKGWRSNRKPGLLAIRQMSLQDKVAADRALMVIHEVFVDTRVRTEDRTLALKTCLDLSARGGESVEPRVSAILRDAALSGQAEFIQECCLALVMHGRRLTGTVHAVLLVALKALDMDSAEARERADRTLFGIFASGGFDEALEALEVLLKKSRDVDCMETLRSVISYLTRGGADRTGSVVQRWLATGDTYLGSAARRLLTGTGAQKFTFHFEPDEEFRKEAQAVYLARKAIGYLMPHATAPISFLVCLLRGARPPAGRMLGELMFDPLLINYPLSGREFLEEVAPSLPPDAQAVVRAVLRRHDEYRERLEEVGFVPELQPSERHRRIEHQKRAAKWVAVRTEAEKRSIVSKLFTPTQMLYGTRAIDYVDNPGEEPRRLDNSLSTITYIEDNPMGWAYDPFGLELMLRIFRTERRPA